ncbi:hypothetical protein PHLCEN_2v9936 [Hermanssonia centrifuga]|uniref:Uncharacterized protein n=1 Tax=Hermanssonia centrifuga TaxID=98765 RepID=A0A2R6NPA5_9APHY|nr:hypothetical protein PHLCEN_2v9936 [Hermanssonia centrifuga]
MFAYVSMNSECVNTPDLRSPTGKPLAEAIPSTGDRLFAGRYDEKKPAPADKGDILVESGEILESGKLKREAGSSRIYSYISLSLLKSVGKNISKYPCFTRSVSQATDVPFMRVWTTGAHTPGIASGKEEKSDSSNRWRGKYSRRVRRRDKRRVGINSGAERLGARGRDV